MERYNSVALNFRDKTRGNIPVFFWKFIFGTPMLGSTQSLARVIMMMGPSRQLQMSQSYCLIRKHQYRYITARL